MIKTIKKQFFHIIGEPTVTQKGDCSGNPNYVCATLGWDSKSGYCYFWDLRPVYRYTYDSNVMIGEPHGLSVAMPYLKEALVRCGRATKKKQEKAEKLFDSNVLSVIQHRLRYRVEPEVSLSDVAAD